MKRHGIPSTITSTGRVSPAFVPGPDEALTGVSRWIEVHRRFRRQHSQFDALRLTVSAWRHGCVLS